MLERKRNDNVIRNRLVALLVACYFLFAYFVFLPVKPVYASETITYTDVLEDLQKDKNFNIEDYPYIELSSVLSLNNDENENNNINLLQVIQISETEDNKLLIYTYQPCKNYSFSLNALYV